MSLFLYILGGFILIGAAGFLFFFWNKKKKEKRIETGLDMSLFLVMMPKYDSQEQGAISKEERSLIAQMEQIYANFLKLGGGGMLKEAPRIAFEIASEVGGNDISFYVAVPKSLETAFEKYVQGVYSQASVIKIDGDYTIFEPGGIQAGSWLKLSKSDYLPINTYQNLERENRCDNFKQ